MSWTFEARLDRARSELALVRAELHGLPWRASTAAAVSDALTVLAHAGAGPAPSRRAIAADEHAVIVRATRLLWRLERVRLELATLALFGDETNRTQAGAWLERLQSRRWLVLPSVVVTPENTAAELPTGFATLPSVELHRWWPRGGPHRAWLARIPNDWAIFEGQAADRLWLRHTPETRVASGRAAIVEVRYRRGRLLPASGVTVVGVPEVRVGG